MHLTMEIGSVFAVLTGRRFLAHRPHPQKPSQKLKWVEEIILKCGCLALFRTSCTSTLPRLPNIYLRSPFLFSSSYVHVVISLPSIYRQTFETHLVKCYKLVCSCSTSSSGFMLSVSNVSSKALCHLRIQTDSYNSSSESIVPSSESDITLANGFIFSSLKAHLVGLPIRTAESRFTFIAVFSLLP